MWFSKKKYKNLEKRITTLESKIQELHKLECEKTPYELANHLTESFKRLHFD